jgi:hypothetical protein
MDVGVDDGDLDFLGTVVLGLRIQSFDRGHDTPLSTVNL